MQINGHLTKDQLRLVAQWKAPRAAAHIEKNSEGYVKEVSAAAFSGDEERTRIEALTLLDGASWPTASVILHLFHKEPYPILDSRALWSASIAVPSQYTFRFWWRYVEYCRDLAMWSGVPMRILDFALWEYSNEHQSAR